MSCITFHGGTNVIGYPWGSYNHALKTSQWSYRSKESPDFKGLDALGKAMKNASGAAI